jgi:hypothetical protein
MYYIFFFIHLETRHVHIAGVTAHPNEAWMMPMARHLTRAEWGVLTPGRYLIHDRDMQLCAACTQRLDDACVKRVPLPPRSPWLNAGAERWIQSLKTEVLSPVMLFGERLLRRELSECVDPHHAERPHQGKGQVILFPSAHVEPDADSPVERRERLGGLLNMVPAPPFSSYVTMTAILGRSGLWWMRASTSRQCAGHR